MAEASNAIAYVLDHEMRALTDPPELIKMYHI